MQELEAQKREEIKKAVEDIKTRFEDFLLEAQTHVKSLRDRQRLKELFREKVESLYIEQDRPLQVGDWVEFMGSKGKVVELKENRASVLFGGVKAWVRSSDLKRVEPPPEEKAPEKVLEFRKSSPSEINLTGFSVEEALTKLELFLQEAHSMGLKSVKVIHGYGALKRAVQEFLSSSPLVVFHREGYPKEGGAGTSLVYLSRD
ncbi:MAG: Smr/MutS family protein [Aquificaceae bacterium]|nr:Smr/MutS family protein [Aquificaceae bacterium]